MHPRYFITCPYTRLHPASNLVEFLVFSAERSSENPYHTREISTSRKVATCLLFMYPHLAHSLPVYGIISRCPMNRIQVASDSAGNLSSSSLLLEFIWSWSKIQQPIEKFSKVAFERNWTRDHLFTGISPPKSCYSQWKHRCFLINNHNQLFLTSVNILNLEYRYYFFLIKRGAITMLL